MTQTELAVSMARMLADRAVGTDKHLVDRLVGAASALVSGDVPQAVTALMPLMAALLEELQDHPVVTIVERVELRGEWHGAIRGDLTGLAQRESER